MYCNHAGIPEGNGENGTKFSAEGQRESTTEKLF